MRILFHNNVTLTLVKGTEVKTRSFECGVQFPLVKQRKREDGVNIFIFEDNGYNWRAEYTKNDFELFGHEDADDSEEASLALEESSGKEERKFSPPRWSPLDNKPKKKPDEVKPKKDDDTIMTMFPSIF